MICNTPYFAGLADCKALWKRVVGFAITEKGTTFTRTTFTTEGTWHTAISAIALASRTTVVLPLLNYENTTDDASIQTGNLGAKRKDLDPPPSMQAWLDLSPCDYKTLFSLEGTSFDVVLFLQGGIQMGSLKSDGNIKGFRATISLRRNLPPSDNAMSSFPVDIFFDLVDEFEDFYLDTPDYTFNTLLDFVPAGLDVYVSTAIVQASGVIIIQVNKRGTKTGLTGLAAADFEVLESNAEGVVAFTGATDNGLGEYSCIVKEDGGSTFIPVGEWFSFQVSEKDATPTYLTYESPAVKVTVA